MAPQSKTTKQIQRMIADLCGIAVDGVVVEIFLDGDFTARIRGDHTDARRQANIDQICNRMRSVYRIED